MPIFKWELWRLSCENKKVKIAGGEIEAFNQHEVLEILRDTKGITPHTDEYLEIIEPEDYSTSPDQPEEKILR